MDTETQETEAVGGFFARLEGSDGPAGAQPGAWWYVATEAEGQPTRNDGTYARFATRAEAEAEVRRLAGQSREEQRIQALEEAQRDCICTDRANTECECPAESCAQGCCCGS